MLNPRIHSVRRVEWQYVSHFHSNTGELVHTELNQYVYCRYEGSNNICVTKREDKIFELEDYQRVLEDLKNQDPEWIREINVYISGYIDYHDLVSYGELAEFMEQKIKWIESLPENADNDMDYVLK